MARFIDGLEGLAVALMAAAEEETIVVNETMVGSTEILYHRVRGVFGDRNKLAELAPYTQNEREELGFTANDPLLRDGSMLRDSVEKEVLGPVGRVGSAEPVVAYHEVGYLNARTQTSVPPRSTFGTGLNDAKPEIITAFEDALGFLFGGGSELAALRRAASGMLEE